MKVVMAILLFITLIGCCYSICTIPNLQKLKCLAEKKVAYCKEETKFLSLIKTCNCGCN